MHIRTPLVQSAGLTHLAGAEVWLKLEAVQPIGSFKIRGIGHACSTYRERGAQRFISSSGGNAGLAVAYAGRKLGVPVTVVVPATTKPRAIELIKQQGADVIVYGANWNEAHAHALTLADKTAVLIHPYDDPLLWEGHATLVDEVREDWGDTAPDLVIISVGGGGLLCGVIQGLERCGWRDTPVLAVETEGAGSLHAACKARSRVTIDAITSIATSLGARQVAQQAFDYAQERNVTPILVSDAAAVHACARFLDDHRILVEPACGASLAPVYDAHEQVRGKRRVLVVVCGGVGITAEQLRAWSQQFAS